MLTKDTEMEDEQRHQSNSEYWKNAEAQFGNVSGKRKRVPSSKMIGSPTHQEDDRRQCQAAEKEKTKKKKKKGCLVAKSNAAMSSAASSTVTFDNLATAKAVPPNDNEADKQDNHTPPPAAANDTSEIEADDDKPAAAVANNTNEIEIDDDTVSSPAAAATNENEEADDDTPHPSVGAPSAAVSKAKVPHVANTKQKTIDKFIKLPSTDKYCVEVDTDEGMWAKCKCGTKVLTRDGRPFDTARFIEHCTPQHNDRVDGGDKAWAKSILEQQKAGKKVNKLDIARAKSILTKQQPLGSFFARKKPTAAVSASSTGAAPTSATRTESSTTLVSSQTPASNTTSCAGLFPKILKNAGWNAVVSVYGNYAMCGNDFKVSHYKKLAVIMSNQCLAIGEKRIIAKNTYYICNACNGIDRKRAKKIAQQIRGRANTINSAVDIISRSSLTPNDHKTAQKFVKSSRDHYSSRRHGLIDDVKNVVEHYVMV